LSVKTERISIVGIATEETYGEAIGDLFPNSSYTNNDAHLGVGKSHTTFDGSVPHHKILFHAFVFEMILRGVNESGSNNIQDWTPEFQLGPFIIAHELGHCRDNELHHWPSIESLKFTNGFDLDVVHNYYFEILVTEIGACLHADRFYSKELLFYVFNNDCHSFENHEAEFKTAKSEGGTDQIYRVACIGSALIWLYLIQYSKATVAKMGTAFESEELGCLFAEIAGIELLHPRIKSAVTSFCSAFPDGIQDFKKEIDAIWGSICGKLDILFVKNEKGWCCYWN
jgi:hypothetical protein